MAKPETLKRGSTFGTDWLQEVADGGVYRANGLRNQVRNTQGGMTIASPDITSPFPVLAEIVSIDYNILTCVLNTPGATTVGYRILVARPPLLVRTGNSQITYPNGQTITYTYSGTQTRSASDGTNSETQVITPQYYVGEIIVAIPLWTGFTYNSQYVTYVDLNTAGRCWAKEAT